MSSFDLFSAFRCPRTYTLKQSLRSSHCSLGDVFPRPSQPVPVPPKVAEMIERLSSRWLSYDRRNIILDILCLFGNPALVKQSCSRMECQGLAENKEPWEKSKSLLIGARAPRLRFRVLWVSGDALWVSQAKASSQKGFIEPRSFGLNESLKPVATVEWWWNFHINVQR
ncbi:hypothetical protein BDN70DRAFT_882267 [Pholiota conissans]|uniref:Uncharacterized protein n=1 Tax=Pholiota conissans TaxID=109636 RepID=A0A9P6CYD8_9AGAR|nr:hypothetical protein BDN70DRAFT_882267 [Pholiota conissans]